jgi:hypothetical protein
MAATRLPAIQRWKPAAVWRIADEKNELGILSPEFLLVIEVAKRLGHFKIHQPSRK